ncbi:phage minor capsid protein [Streptacidiphilus carbonis]|uniref:phage minor capsid protein n=1 Tax=Streptacidiphilus carbonis TaxID=105422 RepID=UPI0005A81A4B|nr:phage minor capsid protein [Streptacidiphilus carbonis]
MATPLPSTSGDAREDHAQQIGAHVGAAVAQAELAVIATVAMLAKRVATGSLLPTVARKQLARTTDTVLTAAVHRALLADRQLPADLAPSFEAAVQSAAVSAQDALAAATASPQQPAASVPRIRVAQLALDALAAQGLVGFVDRAGRRWNLAGYAEMATRTAVSNAWDERQADELTRIGVDLVVVGTHSTEGSCRLCRPWLGRSLSLTGATPGFPTLADAKATGFRHPNCRCSWGTPGMLTAVPSPTDLARSAAAYTAAQRQRTLDRRQRAAHRRMAAAVTPQARTTARRELGLIRLDLRRRQHPFRER